SRCWDLYVKRCGRQRSLHEIAGRAGCPRAGEQKRKRHAHCTRPSTSPNITVQAPPAAHASRNSDARRRTRGGEVIASAVSPGSSTDEAGAGDGAKRSSRRRPGLGVEPPTSLNLPGFWSRVTACRLNILSTLLL